MINNPLVFLITAFTFILSVMLVYSLYLLLTQRRMRIIQRLQGIEVKQILEEEEVLNKPFLERTLGPLANWLKNMSGSLAPQSLQKAVSKKLIAAGKQDLKSLDFITFMIIFGVMFFGLGFFLLAGNENKVIFSLVLGVFGGFLPWFILCRKVTERFNTIRKQLPDIMDLLVVSVEAGLSFDMAMLKVAEKFPGHLGEEFNKTLGEMRMGMNRKEALRSMTKRVMVPELSTMINAVIQSDQLGSSMAGVLRIQADMIRTLYQQRIEEKAMKAPIKLLFPLIFFIFPSMFVVLLGPAFISIMKVLGGM